jgi:hypothetical protein
MTSQVPRNVTSTPMFMAYDALVATMHDHVPVACQVIHASLTTWTQKLETFVVLEQHTLDTFSLGLG